MTSPRSGSKRSVTALYPEQQRAEEQKEQYRKKQQRGLKRRLIVFGTLMAVLGIVAISILISQYTMIQAKDSEIAELEKEYAELSTEEKQLLQDIENYNDLDYIGEVARTEYYFTKPGETIYKVPPGSSD
ncbi:FtsB family cell division protein [Salsuginibacillus kocurii]|uniref:FtsB family cell division protein n=1 Tax=Salsuginibacillus kocurii TaxID=427078 RepID=UPI0003827A6E|nr:septum formation initiator family protein [Salsuginibacillus kocurii]